MLANMSMWTAGLALMATAFCALVTAYLLKLRWAPAPGRLLYNDLAYTDRTVTILINSRPGGRYITALTFPEADPGELESAIKLGLASLEGAARVEIHIGDGPAQRHSPEGGLGFHSFPAEGSKAEAGYILDSFTVPWWATAGQIRMIVRILPLDPALSDKLGPPRLRMEEMRAW